MIDAEVRGRHAAGRSRAPFTAELAVLPAVRAVTRAAARSAAPARKGRRAGQPVQPRQISLTAARRAASTTRTGAATDP